MARPIRVLVVDDSALMRQVMTAILSREPDMEVVIAHEPFSAVRKMQEALPDVILLDLEMPRMDGLTFLRRIRASHPIPVIVCSAFSGAHARAAVRALEYGAIDVVRKPELGLKQFLDEQAVSLVELIRAAASTRTGSRPPLGKDTPLQRMAEPQGAPVPLRVVRDVEKQPWERIVAIGASTGGTMALQKVLGGMPPECPAILIVQHMPAGFTAAFAQRLGETCRMEVREARDGDPVVPGLALVAQGNQHLEVVRSAGALCARVRTGPPVNRHRPSVDVLFDSVANVVGERAVGVLLTGMGDDGASGLLRMRWNGAATIAQDEASCVVYGMPKEAALRGAVETIAPLSNIATAVLTAARRPIQARSPAPARVSEEKT